MLSRTARWWAPALALLLVAGCFVPVGEKIDLAVCDLAARPRDLQPLIPADQTPPPAPEPEEEKPGEKKPGLAIPPELSPGGMPRPLEKELPFGKNVPAKELERAINRVYPPLPPIGDEVPPQPGPHGVPLSLADLQRLALANSPLIKQAAANLESARGAAVQAGLLPNPTVGFQNDTAGTTGGAGYVGGYVEQKITTTNRLKLARAVAMMDVANAEAALRRAETDLATSVRSGYFAVLVARESVRINRALVRLTEEVYRLQIDMVRAAEAASYEPAYLRSLAVQARGNLVQARNRYVSAWKQLASHLGLPGMPLTELAGRIDVPIPVYDHKEVLARVLANHTDVRTAFNRHQQAVFALKLAQVTPIPDVDVRVMVQKDHTGPPFAVNPSVAVSFPVPVWNRNQGGIAQAQGRLVGAQEEPHRVRSALTATLAEAFERYENNRVLLRYYRDEVLPDLVRVYRGVYTRYRRGEGNLNVTDVVQPQQNLANAIGNYVNTLGQLWQAVVDVADLLQTDDLFQLNKEHVPTQDVAAIPDLDHLPGLPCCHPCSPAPEAHHRVVEGEWQAADPRVKGTSPAP
jgi:cobalt-zinc-cadmium efflux system outer membrane protein